MMSVFSILFNTTSNLYLKGCYIFFLSIGGVTQDVVINLAAIDCFKGENMAMWLQSLHSSLYWISITFFRFALAVVPGPPSAKVRNLAIIGILTTFLSVILIFHVHVEFGLIFTSILYGLTDSVLFPLLLTVPE